MWRARGPRSPPRRAYEADDSNVTQLSSVELLQAAADPVRWTVLDRLAFGTRCVCDLQEHVDVSPTLLSYHLRILREAGLVTTARRGRWVDYSLAPDAAARLTLALPGVGVVPDGRVELALAGATAEG